MSKNHEVRKIGILTGGGDCPGLNAVIRGVTKPAQDYGMTVYGILDGFEGSNTLYKYDIESREIENIFRDSLIYGFDVNENNQSIWILSANKLNSDLLQLSYDGSRQDTNIEFTWPTDIVVHPVNGNIIVADYGRQQLYHYSEDLVIIGNYESIGPSKVYVE